MLLVVGLPWLAATAPTCAAETNSSADAFEFFEKKIRPVLVDHCFKCHSAESEKLKGNLRLDSREGMLKGGDTRPAVVPGDPEKSLLIEAIRYSNPDLQMPPKTRLSETQTADFVAWIKMGALWSASAALESVVHLGEFDLEKRRRQHWSWHPIQPQKPPEQNRHDWIRSPVDQFVLAKLKNVDLEPASAANKRTLIRRLYFDLVGLPPTPAEVDKFLHDRSIRAYDHLVDRLLSSPHFGERWARHWLDLVRYAETLGHEFDYPIHNSWRYRDYVIRALNADVPYDQFVTEHIAGDLLSNPRRHPEEGFDESIMGTAFFWFGQQTHSPVDVRQHQADVIENQIDTLTKTFLGLTVACARCHDHKFDAISTRDYYALYGVFENSRYAQRSIFSANLASEKIGLMLAIKRQVQEALRPIWSAQVQDIAQYLRAAHAANSEPGKTCASVAAERNLDPNRLERWLTALRHSSTSPKGLPLEIWLRLATTNVSDSAPPFEQQWRTMLAASKRSVETTKSNSPAYTSFADFRAQDFDDWFLDGEAFRDAPSPAGEWTMGDTNRPVATISSEPSAHSGAISRQLQGALRSPTFTVTNGFLHLLVAGRDSRVNVFIDNFALIQSPIYGALRHVLDHDEFRWLTIDLTMWKGHRAYLEFSDIATPDLASGGKTGGYGLQGYVAVSRVLFSDRNSPPEEPASNVALALLGEGPVDGLETLAHRYQQAASEAVDAWTSGAIANSDTGRAQLALLTWLIQHRLLDAPVSGSPSGSIERLGTLLQEFHGLESSIPVTPRIPAMADGNGLNERVFIRGSPKNLGDEVPRRFLEAIGGATQPAFKQGSGRLELARRITDPSNPFLARVMVNRIWHHIFGRGLVPTPDDLGVLGQPPTHPELLDWLAGYFRDEARWSTKKLIRLLMTSNTYRMSSQSSDPSAEEKDAANALLHRMSVRRLEGEVLRDTLLAVSGSLDQAMFGPSVPVYLNEFMDGRGRPGKSGPLDGAGRRSIYTEVRRNFLSPMMRTFDMPVPFTTVGKRTVSNVPAQSLILMNDPFVVEQAHAWAQRLLRSGNKTPEERINEIFLEAFGRPVSRIELSEALEFLKRQSEAYGADESARFNSEKPWADLCHVIFNAKEFIFIE